MSQSVPHRDGLIRPVSTVLNFIYRIFIFLFLGLSVALVLIVSSDVILRWFGKGIVWADEMSRMLMIWMAFIAMAMGVEVGSHVEIVLFFNLFPKGLQRVLAVMNRLITIAIGCFLVYYGIWLIQIGAKGRLEIVRALPKSMLYLTIPIGGFFIVYFALMHLLGREDLMPSSIPGFYPHKSGEPALSESQINEKEGFGK